MNRMTYTHVTVTIYLTCMCCYSGINTACFNSICLSSNNGNTPGKIVLFEFQLYFFDNFYESIFCKIYTNHSSKHPHSHLCDPHF